MSEIQPGDVVRLRCGGPDMVAGRQVTCALELGREARRRTVWWHEETGPASDQASLCHDQIDDEALCVVRSVDESAPRRGEVVRLRAERDEARSERDAVVESRDKLAREVGQLRQRLKTAKDETGVVKHRLWDKSSAYGRCSGERDKLREDLSRTEVKLAKVMAKMRHVQRLLTDGQDACLAEQRMKAAAVVLGEGLGERQPERAWDYIKSDPDGWWVDWRAGQPWLSANEDGRWHVSLVGSDGGPPKMEGVADDLRTAKLAAEDALAEHMKAGSDDLEDVRMLAERSERLSDLMERAGSVADLLAEIGYTKDQTRMKMVLKLLRKMIG
jgi:hypothetical protein